VTGDRWTRQEFLRRAAAAGLTAAGAAHFTGAEATALPAPRRSGIDHVVVVMMENRSFDHLLGWLPGADGRQAGLAYADAAGAAHSTFPLAPDYQGCTYADPNHSYEGARIAFNGGACDGWLRAPGNDAFAIGYYGEADLPFLGGAARHWTACDRYFAAIMAETLPNRFYMHAAQTDRVHNSLAISRLPTIWDRLAKAGISNRYYFSDVPFLALWGSRYVPISRSFQGFLSDCRHGRLPSVSFVEPRLIGENAGLSNDDHPHADIRGGEAFLRRVYRAVTASPNWRRTVLVITYDEWGGFFDHVPPAPAAIPVADKAAGNVDGLRGFRVPCVVISPFARRGAVSHETLDHTSILRMIEWRWGLDPLTERDATATNLARVLNLSSPATTAPPFPAANGSHVGCGNRVPGGQDIWARLLAKARSRGWKGLHLPA
jgi:phospholipase C